MSRSPWSLEQPFSEITEGQLVDVVAEVTLQHPGYVALRSLAKGQTFFSDIKVAAGYHKVTVFRAIKKTING